MFNCPYLKTFDNTFLNDIYFLPVYNMCPFISSLASMLTLYISFPRAGGSWFAGMGRPNNTGTKLFGISGTCSVRLYFI